MDPVHPITPGPPALPNAGVPPVQRLPRVSRERDRPEAESERRRRSRPAKPEGSEPEEGGPHVDVLA